MGSRARFEYGPTVRRPWRLLRSLRRSPSSSARCVVTLALAEVLVQGGERVGVPGVMPPTASRNVIDKIARRSPLTRANGIACRQHSPLPAFGGAAPVRSVESDSRHSRDVRATFGRRPTGMWCRSSTRRRRSFPIQSASNSSSRKAPARSPRTGETRRSDYARRVDLHRSEIRTQTDRCGWTFIVHRTDRPSATFFCNCMRGSPPAPPPSAPIGGAGRSRGPHDPRPAARLRPAPRSSRPAQPAGAVVVVAPRPAAPAPRRNFRRPASCSKSRRRRKRRRARRGG